MLLLSQAPNGALSARRCAPAAPPAISPFPNPRPPLFSKPRPALPSRSRPARNLRLTLASSSPVEGAAEPGPSSSSSSSSSSPVTVSPPPPRPPFSGGDEKTVFVGQQGVPLEGVIRFDKPGQPSRLESWGRVALLAGGDVLFLLVFAAVGRFSHGLPVLDVATLRTADPFVAGWFLGAYFLGGYGDDGKGFNGTSAGVLAAAKSWAVGIPIGLGIRSLASGHIPPTTFMLITMGTTGFLLIGWRALLYTLLPNQQSKKNDVFRRGNPFELFEVSELYKVLFGCTRKGCCVAGLWQTCSSVRKWVIR
ncbi:hypothetical protein Taro_033015 [Colocasia esculenta]|uniref:Uncharacterized protein n=1 Tax=Colocasia esculenta TaxID=4460 RepID=A0A843W7S6_COLES|nr:hypothetical protein [Colocasia esculenta]